MSDYSSQISETTVGITIPGNAFGLGYSSFKLERKLVFSTPVTMELAAAHEADLADSMAAEIAENFTRVIATLAATASVLPVQATPGITQAMPVPQQQAPQPQAFAPQATANVGTPEGVTALLNGTATPDDGMVTVNGRYGLVTFPHPNVLNEQTLIAGVTPLLAAADLQVDPSHVKIFDNRLELIAGTDRGGHLGAVKIARTGSQAAQNAVGGSAIGWIDWEPRTGKIVIRPTKAFKDLQISVRTELMQPASPSAGNPFR